jgi:hypothetical protein
MGLKMVIGFVGQAWHPSWPLPETIEMLCAPAVPHSRKKAAANPTRMDLFFVMLTPGWKM